MTAVTVDIQKLKKLKRDIRKASKQIVKVGVLDGATYPSGIKVSKVAEFIEFGWVQPVTAKQHRWFAGHGVFLRSGTALRSPPRPVFQTVLNAKGKSWKKAGNDVLKGLENSPLNKIQQALTTLGLKAQQDLQDAIINGAVDGEKFAERSEVTLLLYSGDAKKGKHKMDSTPNQTTTRKPLYRTGLLASSIAFNIEEK